MARLGRAYAVLVRVFQGKPKVKSSAAFMTFF